MDAGPERLESDVDVLAEVRLHALEQLERRRFGGVHRLLHHADAYLHLDLAAFVGELRERLNV